MMKIALLTSIIAPYRVPVFNHLAAHADVDLTVLFMAETEDNRAWVIPKEQINFSYEVLPGWVIAKTYQGAAAFLNPGVIGALGRNHYDVIICGGYNHPTFWLATVYGRLTGTQMLLWSESNQRDSRTHNVAKEQFKKLLIRSFHRFVVPGTMQRDYLTDFGIRPQHIWTAPNAVDVAYFREASEHHRRNRNEIKQTLGISGPVILYVGRLIDAKGVGDLLVACQKLSPNHEATLVIVGSGPDEQKYRAMAQVMNLRVHFAGFRQQDELPLYYGIADIFAFPSHTDQWGLVLNEAMSCGLPVVVSSAPGAVDDLVKHDWNGYIYPAGDVQTLANCLDELLKSPDLRTDMGQRSQEIMQRYTPEKCALGFVNAIFGIPGGS